MAWHQFLFFSVMIFFMIFLFIMCGCLSAVFMTFMTAIYLINFTHVISLPKRSSKSNYRVVFERSIYLIFRFFQQGFPVSTDIWVYAIESMKTLNIFFLVFFCWWSFSAPLDPLAINSLGLECCSKIFILLQSDIIAKHVENTFTGRNWTKNILGMFGWIFQGLRNV